MRWDRDYKNPEVINDPTIIPAYGVTDEERAYWNRKQDPLEFDPVPTQYSDKLMISGAIYNALEEYKVSTVQICQDYFNTQVSGLTDAINTCTQAALDASAAKDDALLAAGNADASALAASASEGNASVSETHAYNSEQNALTAAANAAADVYNAEAWATGTRNGTPVDPSDPTYHNNAKYYADIMINPIDDSTIDTNTTWSSSKMSTELSGKADLVSGKVPAAQLPSYVDDVLEGTAQGVTQTGAGTYSATGFILTGEVSPCTPEAGKTYVDTTTNIQYRWTGSVYVSMGTNLVLGTTSTTAYPGDMGNANATALTALAEKVPSDATSSNKLVSTDTMNTALATKSDTTHTHDDRYYTENEVDTALATKSDTGHDHDDRYYTETEIDNKFNGVTFTTDGDGDICINW